MKAYEVLKNYSLEVIKWLLHQIMIPIQGMSKIRTAWKDSIGNVPKFVKFWVLICV